jgi:hypothetical protein
VIDTLIQIVPILVVLIAYYVRLEIRLAKMCESLKWIKRELMVCRPHSGNNSP